MAPPDRSARARLLACGRDGGNRAEVARRFRTGVSTSRLRLEQVRDEGRRAPRRMGRGPVPPGGKLEAPGSPVAERDDATLAEHPETPAARTGQRRGAPVVCRALERLGRARASYDGPGLGTGPRGRGGRPGRVAGRDGRA